MAHPMNRRQWFKRTGAAAVAGLTFGPGLVQAAPPRMPARRADETVQPVRLSANENPYGPAPSAREAIAKALDEGCRYPFLAAQDLVTLLAEHEGVTPEHIVLGCGSGEVLTMAGMTYGLGGGEIVAAYPTFQGLTQYAESVGAYVHWVDLDDEMKHDLDAMDRRITQAAKLVFICNPNNPTGTLVDPARLRDFCVSNGSRALIFVDEAYIELSDDPAAMTMVDLVKEGHNVIVSRTFSKIHGMAGLRIGYGIMRPDIAERISEYRMGGPNILALRAAEASYQDAEFLKATKSRILEGRQAIYDLCDEVGYRYIPTQGNFVFFETGRDIQDYQRAMREQGVWVGRPFPPHHTWCRVSIGTPADMAAFAGAIRTVAMG